MKIYTYWVDRDASGIPEYIKMCMHTWQMNIPDLSIEIINHSNIHLYLPDMLLTPSFYNLSLAMQSDIVSVWVLLIKGGLFMDADTIVTKDPFSKNLFPADKFSAFGYPMNKCIHLAIMSSPKPNNPLLYQWGLHIAERLSQPLPDPIPWNYVGNGIVDKLLKDEQYASYHHIIDAVSSGNIMEINNENETPYQRYIDFYFTAPKHNINTIIDGSQSGLISLHNSWTPEAYKKASIGDILGTKESLLLSKLLISICSSSF
jgi:hypothetical protein